MPRRIGGYGLLRLLLWKNWILIKRNPMRTAVDILVPVLFCTLIVLIRSLGEFRKHDKITRYPPFSSASRPLGRSGGFEMDPTDLMNDLQRAVQSRSFSPSLRAPEDIGIAWATAGGSEIFDSTVGGIMNAGFGRFFRVIRYDSPEDLFDSLKNTRTTDLVKGDRILCGVIFDGRDSEQNICSRQLKVVIRFPGDLRSLEGLQPYENWQTDALFPSEEIFGPRDPRLGSGPLPSYYAEGFLMVMYIIGMGVLGLCMELGAPTLPDDLDAAEVNASFNPANLQINVATQRYPFIPYSKDRILDDMRFVVPLLIMLAFIYPALSITKVITREKETQMRELMKIMGLPGVIHWVSWFIMIMINLTISSLLITILLKVEWVEDNAVFGRADATLVFAFFFLYSISITCFCFMISSFFSKAHISSVVASLIFFIFYAPHFFFVGKKVERPLHVKLSAAVFMNVAMAFATDAFLFGESNGKGLLWENICTRMHSTEYITMCHVLYMILLDSVMYLLICLYVESVYPGTYGVPKPWNFFFQRDHWLGVSSHVKQRIVLPPLEQKDKKFFEREPLIPAGIEIRNLRKEFPGDKVAVQNLTLNMYEGQITVLLGHNGAGKTTTMSILTGMYTPTQGLALIDGYNVCTNIQEARNSLGLCPQMNVLYDDLTVREHLIFFCKLKGLPQNLIESEINRFLAMLELQPKEHKMSKTLSGGMKRKLNAGMALCAHTKVVLLDEPTSGMDPAARRAIWDMLIMEKEGRTMLLSTHFMDEADVLGDRIAIMAAGTLQCAGSPFFLKKRFGGGYRLIIEKGSNCDTNEVTDVLRFYIPNLSPSQDVGSELSYQLAESESHRFELMFRDLENSSRRLDVKSYGIALTTMEEVFLRTGKDHEAKGEVRRSVEKVMVPGTKAFEVEIPQNEDIREELVEGRTLLRYRIEGLLYKKIIAFVRGWLFYFLHCLFPILFIVPILMVDLDSEFRLELGSHTIALESYDQKIVTVAPSTLANGAGDANVFARVVYKSYKRYVTEQGGTLIDLGYQPRAHEAIQNEILSQMWKNLEETRHTYLVAASIVPQRNVIFRAWFNDLPLHTSGLTLSIFLNSLLRNFDSGVIFINHPLPLAPESQAALSALFSNSTNIAPMISLCMAFISAFFVQFIIRERVCKNKHLQMVSGVNPMLFWSMHFVWDFISFIGPCIVTILILMVFREKGYDTFSTWARLFFVFLIFGLAMLPYMYLLSLRYEIPATGYGNVAMINIFLGIAVFLVISVFRIIDINKDVVDALEWIFFPFPHFCLAIAIHNIFLNNIYNDLCEELKHHCDVELNPCCPDTCEKGKCIGYKEDYFGFSSPGVGSNIVCFLVFAAFCTLLLFLIEYRMFKKMCELCQKKTSIPKDEGDEDEEDSDVRAERERIQNSKLRNLCAENVLVLKNVRKYYGNLLAVHNTSVAIKPQQCFGLLGSNGAGKTTTFKMMTGDIEMTHGDVYVKGLSLRTHRKEVQRLLGYCPQFDALLFEMTGWETLKMFCLLRGIHKENIKRVSEKLADLLLITKHMSRQCGTYSGGNKRKLSTAVALIGNPPVVFLDEPTTGMDPMARRHLWNVICNVRDGGTSVVLTSHSMEECEALCTRIAIQVNGRFKCLGSLQHLKNKFAKGFSLQVKVTPQTMRSSVPPTTRRDSLALIEVALAPVKAFITYNFPNAVLEDEYMGVLTYSIPSGSHKWSQMFGIMQKAKEKHPIEDYSIGQTSLETVFLSFTTEQHPSDD